MGVYGENSCKSNNKIYPIMYTIAIIILITIGSLYESNIIQRNTDYTENSVWWYGFIGILCTMPLVVLLNIVFKYTNPRDNIKTYIWYISHILCYFAITLVSPGQWPFWLAISILWELFECYGPSCGLKIPISCSGMYDITANLAGMGIAMFIRSEIPIKTLLH